MACSLRRYGVTDSGFSIAVTTTRLIQGVLHACLQFILPFSIGIKMLRNYFIFALMSISCLSLSYAGDSTVGRHMTTSYAMDTVDRYSGGVSFHTADYQILMGQNSYFPLNRTTRFSRGIRTPSSVVSLFNLGQELTENHVYGCPKNKKPEWANNSVIFDRNTFVTPGGESVSFYPASHSSKSNWVLDCAPDRSGYVKRIISPYGMSFYYPNAPLLQSIAKTVLTNITYPSLVVDANGNEMSIDYQSNKKVVFKTKYQTVTLTNKELRVSGYPEPIVSYDYNPDGYKGYKVSYAGDSDWTFSAIPGDKTKVCNPLKTCAVYEFKDVTLQGLSHRVIQKKTYTIPHFGHYEVKYTYSDSSGVRNLTVNYPDHVREYSFHDGKMETSLDLTRSWKYGLPISEEVWDKDKTGKLQEITYRHEPSSNWKLFDGKAIKLQKINPIETRQALIRQSNYKPEARMIEKTTKRWAKNDAGQMVWVGTVQEKYSDFTSHNQPQKTTFSYPDTTWSQLFPSVTYVSHYYADHPSHNINLVRETYIEGSSEKTEQTYDNAGNIKTQTVNGLTTRFDYSSNGEMTRMMDPEGNIRTYSQFKFGIPTQETGPEGFTASRTVKNGFVTSETTWGNRTVHYKFDPFGKLTEYQPAGKNRFPIRYYYQYPADGGLELVEQNGNLTKHSYLNGFGKPYKVLTEGLGTGSGAGYAFNLNP